MNEWDGVPQVGFMQELAMKEPGELGDLVDKLKVRIMITSLLLCILLIDEILAPTIK